MKYVCLDYENCDYYEEHPVVNSETPYIKTCPNCLGLVFLVASSTNIKEILSPDLIIELLSENDSY